MEAPRSIIPQRADCFNLGPKWQGIVLTLLGALLSFGCGSRQDAALYSAPDEHTVRSASAPRISTAEQEADSYWSSTYGNARPKLSQTMTLGTSDLPTSAPPPRAAPLPSDATLPGSSSVAQASATTIIVVPGAPRWNPEYRHSAQATRLDPSRKSKQTYAGAPQRTPAPAPAPDNAEVPTKRTSIVAPVVPRASSD